VVLHYIGGKLLDKDFELLDSPMEDERGSRLRACEAVLSGKGRMPENILLPVDSEDAGSLERLFAEAFGGRVYITAPKRGDKRLLWIRLT
jgi:excinuclease UvrABC nuclease subunit